eukprot:3469540-Rhodomonas_salina.3
MSEHSSLMTVVEERSRCLAAGADSELRPVKNACRLRVAEHWKDLNLRDEQANRESLSKKARDRRQLASRRSRDEHWQCVKISPGR